MSNRVRATARGYYGGMIREEGATFDIESKAAFSENWMEWVEKPKAEKPAAPAAEPEAPKKFRFAPKSFKNDAGNREVDIDQAVSSAMTELGLDAAGWNALADGERKEACERAARRLLQESMV